MTTRPLAPAALAALLGLATAAAAHDVTLEAGPAFTLPSSQDPRAGSFQVRAEGTYEASEAWAVFLSGQYTRDFATRTAETSSSGSDVFLLDLGAGWTPDEHWLVALTASGSPPSRQRNATAVQLRLRSVDAVVRSDAWSLGGTALVAYSTGHQAPVEWAFDALAALTHDDVYQQLQAGTVATAFLRAECQDPPRPRLCPLVSGVSTPLLVGRLGGGVTVTLGQDTDLRLAADGFLYDRDPTAVGYFSLLSQGRVELGTGVPLLPLAFALKPGLVQRLGRLTLRASYQLGLYVDGSGSTHALTLKASWEASDLLTVWLSATAQVDASPAGLHEPGGSALGGARITW
jgi:hypothetical protein